jgi:cytochrome P450
MMEPQRIHSHAPTEDDAPPAIATLLTSAASFADWDKVNEAYRWLRKNQPVSRIVTDQFDPFWMITKHADILEIEHKSEIFHSGDRSTILSPHDTVKAITAAVGSPHLTRALVNMDGGEHRQYRSLTQAWFMPPNLKKLNERLRGIAKTHVDRMLALNGECDFAKEVALHYPLHVIMEILGVPEQDETRMLMLTQQLFGARDPELSRSPDKAKESGNVLAMFQSVLADFYAYFDRLTEERRREPRDDLASVIANATIDGKPIAPHEARSYYVLVATAGHDTTSASTAGAIWALAERPDQWAKLKENPALIPLLVDEAIRWVTPVKHFMRSATQDYELRGKTIRAGEWVMLAYLSGNRDEDAFEDPFGFRVDRSPNRHLAFGYGVHVCLGQHLAKMEMRVLFEELISRIKSIELAGTPTTSQSTFISGPKKVPIRFKAE